MITRTLALCTVLFTGSAAAQTVLTGDTLQIGTEKIQLFGITAPSLEQICSDGWTAGKHSMSKLEHLLSVKASEGRPVLHYNGRSTSGSVYGRVRVTVLGVDVNSTMVELGMAWADLKNSMQYWKFELAARRSGVGIHKHRCTPPWEWEKS